MKRNRWLLVLIPLLLASAILGWWSARALLSWLMPWFAMPAPALTRGELTLLLVCLAIVCGNWSGRR